MNGASPAVLFSTLLFPAILSKLVNREALLRPTVMPKPPSHEMLFPTKRTLGGSITYTIKTQLGRSLVNHSILQPQIFGVMKN